MVFNINKAIIAKQKSPADKYFKVFIKIYFSHTSTQVSLGLTGAPMSLAPLFMNTITT